LKTPIVFDTDCISSFLWIDRIDIVKTLFGHQIIIPTPVLDEIKKIKKFSNYAFVYYNVESEINSGCFIVKDITVTNPLLREYMDLISMSNPKRIGKGEASAIVLAKYYNGILASNNLSDVVPYIKNGQPPLLCTEHILFMYYNKGYITADEGQEIWMAMKNKKRILPNYDFYTVINNNS